MGRGISVQARTELLEVLRERYQGANRREKSRILDEFVALARCHRKHAIRLLGRPGVESTNEKSPSGKRIYNEAVREALVVLWEASDRICGKRLKAAIPALAEAMERHGHLDLDDELHQRLFSVNAATIDRLLAPVRREAGTCRKRRRRRKLSARIPVRTFADWTQPRPGFLEVDFVAHCGGVISGAYIHSLVATDVCSGWTEAIPLLVREQSLVVQGFAAIARQLPMPIRGSDSDNDSACKLIGKKRDGARVTKRYEKPATPCERLLAHEAVSEQAKTALRKHRGDLDPVALLHTIREAQSALAAISRPETYRGFNRVSLEHFLEQLPELWLQQEPDSTAKALFERLRAMYPDRFKGGQLRTLQRRVREWRGVMARQLVYGCLDDGEPWTIAPIGEFGGSLDGLDGQLALSQ